jgi:HTH-type transcriptional regulator, glycine betaine synthesis regulator
MARGSIEESKALFVRRWGEMANYWGINRTMAEIHAMLYVSTEPVCTDDVMEALQISRGNASMNLRSLVDWGLVERIHVRGDRKEYFVALNDVWKMFETIVRQRARREVQPILDTIRHCRDMIAVEPGERGGGRAGPTAVYAQRLDAMNELLQAVATVVDLLLKIGPREMDRLSGLVKQLGE